MSTHPCASTRVVKRLAPDQAGAIKLASRFGERLVCVRYRQDLNGAQRYTTVELVVDQSALKRRANPRISPKAVVALRVGFTEVSVRELLMAHGAFWDHRAGLWYMQRKKAKALGMLDRVV